MQQASCGPVHEALDGIVFRAILWFVAAAAITAFPLLLSLPPIIHLAAHAVLPASWALYAAIEWWRERGRPHLETDQWPAAAAIDPGGAVAAQMAAVGLPIGWVAAAAGLLSHHFATSPGTAQALAVDFPILAVTWFLAQLAWRASCQRALADAMAAPTVQGGPNKLRASKR